METAPPPLIVCMNDLHEVQILEIKLKAQNKFLKLKSYPIRLAFQKPL